MIKMATLAIVALSLLAPSAALAENTVSFPDYPDPTGDCRQAAIESDKALGGHGSNSEIIEASANQCIADAQHNYDFAKAIWPRLTQRTAETCANRASASDVRGHPLSQWMALASCASSLYSLQPLPPQTFQK